MLTLTELCKAYGDKKVLTDFSACFGEGLHGISAPSGAGKTTLLRIIAGLETPDSGTVEGAGIISFSFQEARLLGWLSAEKNAALAEREKGLGAHFLSALGLGAELDTPARSLSGGMQRRVSLARALAAPFDTLLLDEPFSGLDAACAHIAMKTVKDACAGKCVLLVTHDKETLIQCDSVTEL